ncbi:mediator of RNA polymerase II transcription subunit 15 [Biomphalaria glabrata]|uniref:Mediator of RNA polymerase II transcription subunit 15 n=1 Tax=Biomphalaria glabrata TaxID=6526 RepID=A0A9U8EHJ4_BIOGL|nr:mediator of RNA polymerase II transcription subunit 15-like [Biomphalaria glabrata]XP_013087482.2 mediator of RNA polymerase II transcription subunit 15-like [Biomphalaria glabrata]XP_013087483.2 mediator of RNA polymerase II transcription subunit 15-like [Biomphalaria glabrata]KAI8738457.1 mediator of RNA polymerase II transcription subunit 15-like [Biomphalaria glabrata]
MASGRAEQFMTNWTSDVFRDRCVAQIDSALSQSKPRSTSTDPVEKFLAQKSSKELEEFVFSQAKSREDYVSLIAEMLMMLRQHGGKPMVDAEVLAAAPPEVLEAAGIPSDFLNGQTHEDKPETE